MSKTALRFYYDIGSLHSWILFEQLCAVEKCFGLRTQFRPVRMSYIYTATGYKNPYYVYANRKHMFEEISTLKRLYGVPFLIPTNAELKLSYVGTESTQRFLTNIRLKYPEYLCTASRFMWKRLWVQDDEVCRGSDFDDIIRESNLPSDAKDFSDRETEAGLRASEQEALDAGCFDVPCTVIERENEPPSTLVGMDSWPLIAKKLGLPLHRQGFYSLRSSNHLFDR